jgi:pimeloyl-ACP methyl ester carboxylesterase
MKPKEGVIEANGLRFSFLESGEGPLVVLLHGFPDSARTWDYQLTALAEHGYRAVAPYLRGYPPTEIPGNGAYDPGTLADDLVSLINALDGERAYVVGHDWGAVMAYAAAALSPESVRRLIVLAVSHPRMFASLFTSPKLIHQSFHLWFFQQEGFAEAAVEANNLALIDYLWQYWSPNPVDSEHIERVKSETLGQPGAVPAALRYYRSLLRLPADDPALFEKVTATISVPTLALFGDQDPLSLLFDGQAECFNADYEQQVIGGSGHFVHRERAGEVTDLILAWISRG